MQKWIHRRNRRLNIPIQRVMAQMNGLRVNVISWNHGGANLECEGLLIKACNPDVDIIVFSSSECGGICPDFFKGSQIHTRWLAFLAARVGRAFVHICSARLQGIVLSVWVSKRVKFDHLLVHRSYSMEVTWDRIGRKGAVFIQIGIGSTKVTFVAAHLVAHTHAFRERTYQLHQIMREAQSLNGNQGVIFVIGDLNFRIDAKSRELIRWLELGDEDKILIGDQLSTLLDTRSDWLTGWLEASRPSFLPTFKVNPKTAEYVWSRRVPAFTDRILIWSCTKQHVHTIEYNKADHSFGSDHFPLLGRFIIMTCV